MVDLAPTSAITDLLWLQKRFQGILELLPKLEEVNSLETYVAEVKKNLEIVKADNKDLEAVKVKLGKDVADARSLAAEVVTSANTQAAAIVAAAKAAAEDERTKGRALLAEEVDELADQKAKKVAELAALNESLKDAEEKVASATSQYEALSNLIEEMKAKFS